MNATPEPIVSIVMPAYNSAKFLVETMESMLAQTLRDFEFIVVNDGSTDDTLKILRELEQRDPRIRVVDEGKRGFVGSLNRGCALARGTYIARMDADDISLPQRLEKQVQYLEAHPHIDLCGTWAYAYTGESAENLPIMRFPQTPAEVRCALIFFSALCHPSVMFRRTLFAEDGLRYEESARETADYALWVATARTHQIGNLSDILLWYRIHPGQVTQADRPRQQQLARDIRCNLLRSFGIEATESELDVHSALGNWSFKGDLDWLQRTRDWLLKLYHQTRHSELLDRGIFSRLLADYWFLACIHNTRLGFKVYRMYLSSPLGRINLQMKNHLHLASNAILRREKHDG